MDIITWLDGKKTILGGAIKICGGVGAVLAALLGIVTNFTDPQNPAGIGLEAGLLALMAGVYAIGQGAATIGEAFKQDKLKAAVLATVTSSQSSAVSNLITASNTGEIADNTEK